VNGTRATQNAARRRTTHGETCPAPSPESSCGVAGVGCRTALTPPDTAEPATANPNDTSASEQSQALAGGWGGRHIGRPDHPPARLSPPARPAPTSLYGTVRSHLWSRLPSWRGSSAGQTC